MYHPEENKYKYIDHLYHLQEDSKKNAKWKPNHATQNCCSAMQYCTNAQ
jgi:hypothetical protein